MVGKPQLFAYKPLRNIVRLLQVFSFLQIFNTISILQIKPIKVQLTPPLRLVIIGSHGVQIETDSFFWINLLYTGLGRAELNQSLLHSPLVQQWGGEGKKI